MAGARRLGADAALIIAALIITAAAAAACSRCALEHLCKLAALRLQLWRADTRAPPPLARFRPPALPVEVDEGPCHVAGLAPNMQCSDHAHEHERKPLAPVHREGR